jgi:hypothetical protein
MDPDPRRWSALAVLLLAAFMDFVDVSIVLIAPRVAQGAAAASRWSAPGSCCCSTR